ncbi:hypothetical protein J8J27_33940, partial [Mycobacterium tuberculosis]|nr:hypothetical protein [Mycobacterium tuberculosis]
MTAAPVQTEGRPKTRLGQELDAAGARAAVLPTLRRVFADYLWPHKRRIFIAVGAMLFNSAATGLIPLM